MVAFKAAPPPQGPPVAVLDMDEVLYAQLETFFEICGRYYVQYGLAEVSNAAQISRKAFEDTGCGVAHLAKIANLGDAWFAEYYPIICNACNDAVLDKLGVDDELLEHIAALHRAGVVFALLTHNYRTHALKVIDRMGLAPYLSGPQVMGDECLGKERRKYTTAAYLALEERLPAGRARIMHDDQPRNLVPLAELAAHGWSGRLIGPAPLPDGLGVPRYARLHDALVALRHEMGA